MLGEALGGKLAVLMLERRRPGSLNGCCDGLWEFLRHCGDYGSSLAQGGGKCGGAKCSLVEGQGI
jgi:hypothetical protein